MEISGQSLTSVATEAASNTSKLMTILHIGSVIVDAIVVAVILTLSVKLAKEIKREEAMLKMMGYYEDQESGLKKFLKKLFRRR